eukprot:scaffold21.g2183.t1
MEDAAVRMKVLYSVMQSVENRLGGGEGVEGLYGSINRSGMQKVVESLRAHCGLDSSSHLVDIGAGLGRPLMHALVDPGIASAAGVEIDRIKCDKASAFLAQTIAELRRRGLLRPGELAEAPRIQCAAIEQVRTLDPATHAYSFWEGVPPDGKAAFGRLVAASRSLRGVAVVQRAMRGAPPPGVMAALGFGKLALAQSFAVSMSGSGRSFTCYVFCRAVHPASLARALPPPLPAADRVGTPSRTCEGVGAAASEVEGGRVGREAQAGDDAASAPPRTAPAELLPAQAGASDMRRGMRQRQPSAKAQQAQEEEEEEEAWPSTRAQRATRRAAAAAAPPPAASRGKALAAAAGGRPRASPSKGSPHKASKGVQKSSPAKSGQSPSKAKARGGLLGGALSSLRQQKVAAVLGAAAGQPAKPAAAKAAAGSGPAARRGLLGGLRSAARSVQQALGPPAGEGLRPHAKSQ